MIHWLPSYGNLVILRHAGGFHTVYAHLSDIVVSEGQQVSDGMVIAKSGDSVAGSILLLKSGKRKKNKTPKAGFRNAGSNSFPGSSPIIRRAVS